MPEEALPAAACVRRPLPPPRATTPEGAVGLLPEAAAGHPHYRALFLGACCLFLLTFVLNTVAEILRQRLRERYKVV